MNTRPRLIVAGLSGGAGKTILSLGLARALSRSRSQIIQTFKKGPDYIDAAWLGLAAQAETSNLDPFLLDSGTLAQLFLDRSAHAHISIIEGNRGLFDGKDRDGSCSTAELARQLQAPVLLVMDATKMTRTAAALVHGCKTFEPDLRLAGVICNRTAGERHRAILKETIEHYTSVPVLGMLPKAEKLIPERHMGLFSYHEQDEGGPDAETVLNSLADMVEEHIDLDAVLAAARTAPALESPALAPLWPEPVLTENDAQPRIGYVHDAALWFYYPENLEALRRAGAALARVSVLSEDPWPELDGLYLGGGFPETLAEPLAANSTVRQRVRMMAEMGLPIYAECGGFMYLGRSVVWQGQEHPMAGVFPVRTELCAKPQGLGYVTAQAVRDTPFFPQGETLRAHEFHYSRCVPADGAELTFSLRMTRGEGMLAGFDGLVYKNTFATYAHTHALGFPGWAKAFVTACAKK